MLRALVLIAFALGAGYFPNLGEDGLDTEAAYRVISGDRNESNEAAVGSSRAFGHDA